MRVDPQKDIVLDVSSTSSEESEEDVAAEQHTEKPGRNGLFGKGKEWSACGMLSIYSPDTYYKQELYKKNIYKYI